MNPVRSYGCHVIGVTIFEVGVFRVAVWGLEEVGSQVADAKGVDWEKLVVD